MSKSANQLISIIVPVYNMERYLDDCLSSLVNQTYRQIEIILVDDGSTDSSYQLCKKYKEHDERIVLISQDNAGLSAARNVGIENSCGEWLFFLDSDDMLRADALSVLLAIANRLDTDIVCGDFSYNESELSKCIPFENVSYRLIDKKLLHYSIISNHACGKLYSATLFKDTGIRYPINRRYEDIATTYLLFDKACSIGSTKEALYFYRQRSDSITSTPSMKDIQDLWATYKEAKAYYSDHDDASARYFLCVILYQIYRLAALSGISCEEKQKEYREIEKELPPGIIATLLLNLNKPMSVKLIILKLGILDNILRIKSRLADSLSKRKAVR